MNRFLKLINRYHNETFHPANQEDFDTQVSLSRLRWNTERNISQSRNCLSSTRPARVANTVQPPKLPNIQNQTQLLTNNQYKPSTSTDDSQKNLALEQTGDSDSLPLFALLLPPYIFSPLSPQLPPLLLFCSSSVVFSPCPYTWIHVNKTVSLGALAHSSKTSKAL